MKTRQIDKVETFTIRFVNDSGGYAVFINGKQVRSAIKMPGKECLKVARTLGRIALTHWMWNDEQNNKE